MPYAYTQKPRPTDGAFRMAGATGLEPATSGVTGRRSNQLNYAPYFFSIFQTYNLPESSSGRSNQLNYAPYFLNPKFEYRNTKQIRNLNSPNGQNFMN